MSSSPHWMRPVDAPILDFLAREGPELRPFVASRTGTHLKYAERRFEELERRGYITCLEDGRYTLTERGRQYDEERSCSAERAAEAD